MTTSIRFPDPSSPHPVQAGTGRDVSGRAPQRLHEGRWILLSVALMVGLVWMVSQRRWFEAGDDIGYWLGVAGGSMMLLLLVYPLRKHVRALHRVGSVKVWLWGHMLLGIGGPLLILLHCGLRAKSLNAEAALYSMLVVAGSGVLGRFLYVRVNRGLVAERAALRDYKLKMGLEGERRSFLWFAPELAQELSSFESEAIRPDAGGRHWLRLMLVLPLRSWMLRERVQRQARAALRQVATKKGWDATMLRRTRRRVRRAIRTQFTLVMRVALYTAWERLFALWHVAHIPFVFLLVIAGVAHVVAVHAY